MRQTVARVISQDAPPAGAVPALIRAAASAVAPLYAGVIAARNALYDRRVLPIARLPRPVISIGNLSAGGAGKTPVVRHLADALRQRGLRVAILARGYGARPGQPNDEQLELHWLLNTSSPADTPVAIAAHPHRYRAGLAAMAQQPAIDVFLLDDAFQHRRLHRDLDVVLLSAPRALAGAESRLLPAGLLREPPSALRRAGVVILTRADLVPPARLEHLRTAVRAVNPAVEILTASHVPNAVASATGERYSLAWLDGRRVFATAAIADPTGGGFVHALVAAGAVLAGQHWFADHHTPSPAEWAQVGRQARAAGADCVVVTGKDAVKVSHLPPPEGLDVVALLIDVHYAPGDAERLVRRVLALAVTP